MRRRPLNLPEILQWARVYHDACGRWPTRKSGPIVQTHSETWAMVDKALREGYRGFSGGSSLAHLLVEHFGVRIQNHLPPLNEKKVLAWADEFFRAHGRWPEEESGSIPGSNGETWRSIDAAMQKGLRSLERTTLAQFLGRHRGKRNKKQAPRLTREQVLGWADVYHERHGRWPTARSGPIDEAPGETWSAVQSALGKGCRGFPGGDSLPILLAEYRQARNVWTRPSLTIKQILAWADEHRDRTGHWPTAHSGPVANAPGERWANIDRMLTCGGRGLDGGLSVSKLLVRERNIRNPNNPPGLTTKLILNWADLHYQRSGDWPTENSGSIVDALGENWKTVDLALRHGSRGLRGGSSLPRLLQKHRGKRNVRELPKLSYKLILSWADHHHEQTGKWPNVNAGEVLAEPGEKWRNIEASLLRATRGLPGGLSLAKLLAKRRGVRNQRHPPRLSEEQIVAWARRHFDRCGKWPTLNSGVVADDPHEKWCNLDNALRCGKRGLRGGSSLAKLLAPMKQLRASSS